MVIADAGYQSDWVDILQTLVHAPRVRRRDTRRARRGDARLLRRRAPPRVRRPRARAHRVPGRDVGSTHRHPDHARPRRVLRRRRARHRGARQGDRRARDRDRHDPRLRDRPRVALQLARDREHAHRSRTCCSATCSRSPRTSSTVFALRHRRGRGGARRDRSAAHLRVGRPAGRRGQRRAGQGARASCSCFCSPSS